MYSLNYSQLIAHHMRSCRTVCYTRLGFFVRVFSVVRFSFVCLFGWFLVTIYFKLEEILSILLRETRVSAMQVDYRKDQAGIRGLVGLNIALYFSVLTAQLLCCLNSYATVNGVSLLWRDFF